MHEERAMPGSDGRRCRYLLCHTHRPQKGRNGSIAGLINAPTPHSAPNRTHPCHPGHRSISSATRKINAKTSGVKVVSHIQWTDQYQTQGLSAQARADQSATRGPKVLCAIRKTGMVVSAEKRQLIESRTHAEAYV